MLPASNRLHRSADFTEVVRGGRRSRRGSLVVHQSADDAVTAASPRAPIVGLIVSRAVGNSVVRHRVARRLRAQLTYRLPQLALGSRTVVRALPAAGQATSAQLGSDLDRALTALAGAR